MRAQARGHLGGRHGYSMFRRFAAVVTLAVLRVARNERHARQRRTSRLVTTFNANGTASSKHRGLTHLDTGSYVGTAQIGIGRYRFESTFNGRPDAPTRRTPHGRAPAVRRGEAHRHADRYLQCFPPGSHLGSSVEAQYSIHLTSGTRDLGRRHLRRELQLAVRGAISGTAGAEGCGGDGNVNVTARVGYAMVDDHAGLDSFGGAALVLSPVDSCADDDEDRRHAVARGLLDRDVRGSRVPARRRDVVRERVLAPRRTRSCAVSRDTHRQTATGCSRRYRPRDSVGDATFLGDVHTLR